MCPYGRAAIGDRIRPKLCTTHSRAVSVGWALWALSPRLDDLCWLRVVAVELALPVVPQPHVGLDVHRVVLFNVDVHRHQSVGDDN